MMPIQNLIRHVIRDVLLEECLLQEGPDDSGIFKAIFMAGAPGSGKGHALQEIFGTSKGSTSQGLVIVNVDAAYELALKKLKAAIVYHDMPADTASAEYKQRLRDMPQADLIKWQQDFDRLRTGELSQDELLAMSQKYMQLRQQVVDEKQAEVESLIQSDADKSVIRSAKRSASNLEEKLRAHEKVHATLDGMSAGADASAAEESLSASVQEAWNSLMGVRMGQSIVKTTGRIQGHGKGVISLSRLEQDPREQTQLERLILGRLGIIIDGTGATATKILADKELLESMGYDTMMIAVSVPKEQAVRQNIQRGRAGGREVNVSSVRNDWQRIQDNIPTYADAFSPFILVDNDNPASNAVKEVMGFIGGPLNSNAQDWVAQARAEKSRL